MLRVIWFILSFMRLLSSRGFQPKWSVWLLAFVWAVALLGITCSWVLPGGTRLKQRVSLTLYLCMGYAALVALPDLHATMPPGALRLLGAGGAAYTLGVPLFVRNRNLDHAIWHVFVLAGSALHWVSIYVYLLDPTCCGAAAAAL